MSDFTERYSKNTIQQLFEQAAQQSENAYQTMQEVAPEIDQLQNEATAIQRAFSGSVDTLTADQEDIYAKIAKTRSVPLRMGKLLGMILPEYNEEALITKAQANSSALAATKNKTDAALSLVGQKAQALETKVSNRLKAAQLANQSASTVISGLSTMMTLEDKERDQQKALLMSYSPKDLENLLEKQKDSDVIKIKGKEYSRDVVFGAYTSRQTLDAQITKLHQDVTTGNLNISEKMRAERNATVDGIVKELTAADMLALKPDDAGNVLLQSSTGGPAIKWNFNDLQSRYISLNESMKGARDLQAQLAIGAEKVEGYTSSLLRKTEVLAALTGTGVDDTGRIVSNNIYGPEMALASNAVRRVNTQFGEIRTKVNEGKPLSLEDYSFMVDPQSIATNENIANTAEASIKKVVDSLKQGKSEVSIRAIDEMINNGGQIVTADTALNKLGEDIFVPSSFTGYRAALGNYAEHYKVQEGQSKANIRLNAKGMPADPVAFVQRMMTQGVTKDTATLRYLQLDQSVRDSGIAGGFEGAVVSNDLDYLLNTAVNRYVTSAKQAGGTTPLDSIILSDGRWAPSFLMQRDQVGTSAALMAHIARADAKLIGEGKQTIDDAFMGKFSGYVLNQLQQRQLTLPGASSEVDASVNKIVYNNRPEERLTGLLHGVFGRANQTLKAAIDENLSRAGTEAAGAAMTLQQRPIETLPPSRRSVVEAYHETMRNTLGALP